MLLQFIVAFKPPIHYSFTFHKYFITLNTKHSLVTPWKIIWIESLANSQLYNSNMHLICYQLLLVKIYTSLHSRFKQSLVNVHINWCHLLLQPHQIRIILLISDPLIINLCTSQYWKPSKKFINWRPQVLCLQKHIELIYPIKYDHNNNNNNYNTTVTIIDVCK